MNALVALLLGGHGHNHHHDIPKKTKKSTRESVNKALSEGVNGPPCCSPDPVKQLNDIQRMASVLENEDEDAAKDGTGQKTNEKRNKGDTAIIFETETGQQILIGGRDCHGNKPGQGADAKAHHQQDPIGEIVRNDRGPTLALE